MTTSRMVLVAAAIIVGIVAALVSTVGGRWSSLGRDVDGTAWAVDSDSIADLGNSTYRAPVRWSYSSPRPFGWDRVARNEAGASWSVLADTIQRFDDDTFRATVRTEHPGDLATGSEPYYEITDLEVACTLREYGTRNSTRFRSDDQLLFSEAGDGTRREAPPGTIAESVLERICVPAELRAAQMADSVDTWDPVFTFDNVIVSFDVDCEGNRVRQSANGRYLIGDRLVYAGDPTIFLQWEQPHDGTMGLAVLGRVCRLEN